MKQFFYTYSQKAKQKIIVLVNFLLISIEKIYNSVRYNGFYILISLLFPIVIWKLDAGEEIIISMTETAFWQNILLSLTAFAALAFSVWCIPTLAIKFFQVVANYKDSNNDIEKNNQLKHCLFKQLIFVYNGLNENDSSDSKGQSDTSPCISTAKKRLQIAMRYFAIAPWILFILTCIKIFFKEFAFIWVVVLLIAAILFFLIWIIDKNKTWVTKVFRKMFTSSNSDVIRPNRFNVPIFMVLIVIVSTWIFFFVVQNKMHAEGSHLSLKWIMIILHTICLLASYGFIVFMENEKFERKTAYKISNESYRWLIIFLVMCISSFYFLNEMQFIQYVSPINVIIIIATAFIVFFEFFFTSQQLLISIVKRLCTLQPNCHRISKKYNSIRLQAYKYVLVGLLFWLTYQFFFSSLNSHRIRVSSTTLKVTKERQDLTDYFENWIQTRNIASDDSVVYLISGQGGGSRAAAHFFMTMGMLEKNDSNFFKKVFCISTASGSTSGAQMFLASKYYGKIYSSTDFIGDKGIKLYSKNYMSSAFFGLMVGDGIEHFTSLNDLFPHDRNYHLQKEELDGFNQVFNINGRDFFENDYMFPYVDKTKHWPLFMINTTVVNFGVRGLFSPVKTNFSLARDLYGHFIANHCNDKKDLPLVTCVNQSQAFPILSSYNYMECTGRLADGGIVENTGCATTLEVYEALRRHCCKMNRKGIRIICLNFYNSKLEEDFKAPFKKASVLNTLTAAIHSPFDGAQFYAYKNLSKKIAYLNSLNLGINSRDTVVDFGLDTAITLTRTLSRDAAKRIFKYVADDTIKFKYKLPFHF
jgi:hypothetical protein